MLYLIWCHSAAWWRSMLLDGFRLAAGARWKVRWIVTGIHLSAPWISVTDFIAIQWLPSGGPTNFPPPESHCYSKANNAANLLLQGCVGVIWWLFIDRGWQHECKQPRNHHPTSHFDRFNAIKSCIVLRPLFFFFCWKQLWKNDGQKHIEQKNSFNLGRKCCWLKAVSRRGLLCQMHTLLLLWFALCKKDESIRRHCLNRELNNFIPLLQSVSFIAQIERSKVDGASSALRSCFTLSSVVCCENVRTVA